MCTLLSQIVFSATYLAMSLLQLFSGNVGYGKDVVLVRRGASYYGNSDVFRGGNNFRNPHADGDEHNQYVTAQVRLAGDAHLDSQKDATAAVHQEDLARVQANKAAEQSMLGYRVSPGHDGALAAARPNRKLRSATLAEQAVLEEERRMAGKPVAAALLPAFEHVEHVEHVEPYPPTAAADASGASDAAAAWPADKRKPAMPFNRLNDPTTKLAKGSRLKQRLPAERDAPAREAGVGAEDLTAREPVLAPAAAPASAAVNDEMVVKIEAKKAAVAEGSVLSREEEEDLEAEIAELREKSLSRKLTRSRAARLSSDLDADSVEESEQLPLDRPAHQAPIVRVSSETTAGTGAAGLPALVPAQVQTKKRPGAKLALMVKKRPSLFDGSNAPSSEKQQQQQERQKVEIERAALLSE